MTGGGSKKAKGSGHGGTKAADVVSSDSYSTYESSYYYEEGAVDLSAQSGKAAIAGTGTMDVMPLIIIVLGMLLLGYNWRSQRKDTAMASDRSKQRLRANDSARSRHRASRDPHVEQLANGNYSEEEDSQLYDEEEEQAPVGSKQGGMRRPGNASDKRQQTGELRA